MNIEDRVVCVNEAPFIRGKPVYYWMSRDQRIRDNWALLFARELARREHSQLKVVFFLNPEPLPPVFRYYDFMLKGLRRTAAGLKDLNIPFELFTGASEKTLSERFKNAGAVVTDFNPLTHRRIRKQRLTGNLACPVFTVDAHNIVPAWKASDKKEYGAYTIRPKLHKRMALYCTDFPEPELQAGRIAHPKINWKDSERYAESISHKANAVIQQVPLEPGEHAALQCLRDFIDEKLDGYADNAKDPTKDGTSRLSAYLHFGQLSAQRAVLEVMRTPCNEASKEAFVEQLFIRKELSDNFCLYTPDYDATSAFPAWAHATLEAHKTDIRDPEYVLETLESGNTYDRLWNAAQRQLLATGYIHGYMRMYWCKKILEWSRSPEEAMRNAVTLNDRYSLDGSDPNGYAGIAWSIGGVHDRPWKERPVFGQIRYMNDRGAARKFDTELYIRTWDE